MWCAKFVRFVTAFIRCPKLEFHCKTGGDKSSSSQHSTHSTHQSGEKITRFWNSTHNLFSASTSSLLKIWSRPHWIVNSVIMINFIYVEKTMWTFYSFFTVFFLLNILQKYKLMCIVYFLYDAVWEKREFCTNRSSINWRDNDKIIASFYDYKYSECRMCDNYKSIIFHGFVAVRNITREESVENKLDGNVEMLANWQKKTKY